MEERRLTIADVEAELKEVHLRADQIPKYDANGNIVVYKWRWMVLMCYCLGMFSRHLQSERQAGVVQEFARFFNTTNDFRPRDGEIGIDGLLVIDGLSLVLMYAFGGFFVDRFGLVVLKIGSTMQAIATWWVFLAGANLNSVVISRVLSNFGGVLIVTSLLRVSGMWFPAPQRPLAVAIGVYAAILGGGAAIIMGPLFYEPGAEETLDLTMKSCKKDFVPDLLDNVTCTAEAVDNFCCYTPLAINKLNLVVAIISTSIAIICVLLVRNAPPTPPSPAGHDKGGPTIWTSFKLMFKHSNYLQICLADFITTGPLLVLYSALSRLFAQSIQDYVIIVAATGLVLSAPATMIYGGFLGKSKKFFEYTAAPYTIGLVVWTLLMIVTVVDTDVSNKFALLFGGLGVIIYSLWTVVVYELKLEYVFTPEANLEGMVVAVDRALIDLSQTIFLFTIAPEKFNNEDISGRGMTFIVGTAIMIVGVTVIWTIRRKRDYNRLAYEEIEEPLEHKIAAELESLNAQNKEESNAKES